jgi:aryl-alcohol dehydrogenase-like predicted oxidoreductase
MVTLAHGEGIVELRKLGNTHFHVTAIGLGAWAIGGEWVYDRGPLHDIAAAITSARLSGCRSCNKRRG